MNKQFFAKIAGTAALALLLHPGVFAQSNDPQKPEKPDREGNPGRTARSGDDPDKLGQYDEIVIKRKAGKDAKVTVEIRDDQVFVDGMPVSQYNNDTISVRKKKSILAPPSPFRNHGGDWNYGANEGPDNVKPALLGVYSEKNEAEGGAKIKEITPGSAAEKAGLQKGDVITGVDEIKITDPDNLYDAIHNKYKPEDKVTITYQREGKDEKVAVILGAGKRRMREPDTFTLPGMGDFDFRNLPTLPNGPNGLNRPNGPNGLNRPGEPFGVNREEGRPKLGIHAQDTEDGKGVKVLEVDEGSFAEKAGIKEGDIITRFDGKEVNSALTLAEIARNGKDKTSVKIGLTRNGSYRELEIKIPRRLKTADL